MTLPVPLTVRVGDKHITEEVSAVTFRKEAIGGVKSIAFRLAHPLNRFDPNLAAYSRCYIYDARAAGETIAEGRLSDFGRSASIDGQQWDMVAFGPAQHATDETLPLIYMDQGLDGWIRRRRTKPGATAEVSNDPSSSDTPALFLQFPEGLTLATNDFCDLRYEPIADAGLLFGHFSYDWDAGIVHANYKLDSREDSGTVIYSDTLNTAGGSHTASAGGTMGASVNNIMAILQYTGAGGVVANDNFWGIMKNVFVGQQRKTKAGVAITGASTYPNQYVLAHQVVEDLLGRMLPQFDGANATVAQTGTHQIDQLAYPDGVTAEQVLDDLMVLEPAFRWYATPNNGGPYSFFWEAWPTTVRYEVTLDDGGDFPASAQEVYNRVTVRWRRPNGRVKTTHRSRACAFLDDKGIIRRAFIDTGDEIGSVNGAQRAGDNFLASHNVPANAGTITIARPIRDLIAGRLVAPHEIEPGELIRVRGLESYPDALNASSSDGQTVFRIWSTTYNSDANAATLELDVPARTVTNALAKLAKRRIRKR